MFSGDAFGGLIASLIALPYGLAMATLMGLPPVLGLFTSIVTAPIIALMGRNPVMIGGTASATVPFIADAVHRYGIGGAAKLGIITGVLMMVLSVMRLGRHIQKVPVAVVSGFSCGIGALMIILQLDTILGLAPSGGGAPVTKLVSALSHLDAMRWQPFVLAIVVIAISQTVSKFSKRIPGPLVAIALAVLLSQALGLHEKQVGSLPLEIPSLAAFTWSPLEVASMLASGCGLAFVVSVNVLLTARVVEHFRGKHEHGKHADADAELGAYGIANVVAGMFGAPVSVGIPARSVANVRCGGQTRMSNLYHAGFLVTMLWLGGDIVAGIPIPALAGVTAWMGWCLLDWSTWRRLPRMRKADAAAFLVTAGGVLVMNAVAAVAAGCAMYGFRWWRQRQAGGAAAVQAQAGEAVKA